MTDADLGTGGGFGLYRQLTENDLLLGKRLGDYRIESLLAEGGMSRVYVGSRVDGAFERQVAIKVSAIGAWSDDLAQRFLREQRLLATFNHPNICQLYDTGVTEQGWPYIVMELVDGEDIASYVQHHALSMAQKLRLLQATVEAVAFAHARLVVHRDLKPSNVLVDAEGRVRLLDFGIAKLVDDDQTLAEGQRPFTPRYASPEQLLDDQITVGSDVYQLGLIAYEVLTGTQAIGADSLAELIKAASDQTPVSLKFGRDFPRELRAIIEKCCEPDPADRYTDSFSLAADLRAFLEQRPVQALGRSPLYGLQKLVQRNRAPVALATILLLTLVAGSIAYTVQIANARDEAQAQAERANLEARRASEVVAFMSQLFGAVSPNESQGEAISLRAALDRGVDQVRAGLTDQPELKSSLLLSIADTYMVHGYLDEAEEMLEESMDMRRALPDADWLRIAEVELKQAELAMNAADFGLAGELVARLSSQLGGLEGERTALLRAQVEELQGNHGFLIGEPATAEVHWRQALDILQEHELDNTQLGVTLQYNLVMLRGTAGDYAAEIAGLRPLIPKFESTFGLLHPMMQTIEVEMAWASTMVSNNAEAIEWALRSLNTSERVYGEDHSEVADSLSTVAMIYAGMGALAEAASHVERAVEIKRARLGALHSETGLAHQQLAYVYIRQERYDEAEAQLEFARKALWETFAADTHRFQADWYFASGGLAEGRGNLDLAAERYSAAWRLYEELVGETHVYVSDATTQLARVRAKQERLEEAQALYAIGVPILLDLRGPKAESTVREATRWADVLTALDRPAEAERVLAMLDAEAL